MSGIADETAYYFNGSFPAVVLINKGVRLPLGMWLRVASPRVTQGQVELMLGRVFPDLKGKVLRFARLITNSDVRDFEDSVRR